MRIVFTVGTYYPLYSAVGRCAKNLVDVLTSDNEVTVLAQRRFDSPERTDNLGLSEHLIYISTKLEDCRANIDRHMNQPGSSSVWHAGDRIIAGLRYAKTAFGKTACHRSMVNAYLKGLSALNNEPDQLIPCSLPFEGVVACALYKRHHPHVRLTPIIFDQFADSATLYKSDFQKRIKWNAGVKLERMVVESSDCVFNVSWDEHVRESLPDLQDKFHHIEHPMLVQRKLPVSSEKSFFGDGLHAVYAGALNAGVRDPSNLTNLFEGFSRNEGFGLRLHAYVMGDGVQTVRDVAGRNPDDIEVHDPVSPDELLSIYSAADILISVGNNVINQHASKITEYLATGKPIVHVSCRDDDPAIRELERYPLGLVLKAGDGAINQDKLAAFARETTGKRVPFETVAALFPDEVPANVAALICGRSHI